MPSTISRALTLVGGLLVLAAIAPNQALAQFVYPPPYPYYYGGGHGYGSEVRLSIQPKDASVYVDGYFAGKVDDFDGTFQRLRIEPGQHELVIYQPGYRSLTSRLYLGPGATQKITGTLERLAPGEPEEARPEAVYPPPPRNRPSPNDSTPYDPNDQPPADAPLSAPTPQAAPRPAPPVTAPAPPDADQAGRAGTLSLSIEPNNTQVTIDGQPWKAPNGRDWLLVQVTPGRHTVEVRRDGYRSFTTEIHVQGGETVPIIVSLSRER